MLKKAIAQNICLENFHNSSNTLGNFSFVSISFVIYGMTYSIAIYQYCTYSTDFAIYLSI